MTLTLKVRRHWPSGCRRQAPRIAPPVSLVCLSSTLTARTRSSESVTRWSALSAKPDSASSVSTSSRRRQLATAQASCMVSSIRSKEHGLLIEGAECRSPSPQKRQRLHEEDRELRSQHRMPRRRQLPRPRPKRLHRGLLEEEGDLHTHLP